jgi:hypothetical protein
VGLERAVGFFLDGGGQSIASDVDDGIDVMGLGAVDFALGGCECDLGHGTIIV